MTFLLFHNVEHEDWIGHHGGQNLFALLLLRLVIRSILEDDVVLRRNVHHHQSDSGDYIRQRRENESFWFNVRAPLIFVRFEPSARSRKLLIRLIGIIRGVIALQLQNGLYIHE